MKFPQWLNVYGDQSFRGECPQEELEQAAFFNRIRASGDSAGLVALHPKNEGARKGKDFFALQKDKALGLTKGAADIIIPGSPAFVCELKRRDHTKSHWQQGQQEYLEAAQALGAFVCVALGADAAIEAYKEWRALAKN